jgi:uncharacterized protein YkvS|tara:strand:+ start:710 stop:1654 length:945 start_codon:yes stop_codon:yes gene_type:complete
MYIDIETKRLLPSLPNVYKHTSNFQALTEDELTGLFVYPIESFHEDNNYTVLTDILGTKYIEYDQVTLQSGEVEIGKDVKVVLDEQYFIDKINTDKGQTGNYPTVKRALLNQPIVDTSKPEEPPAEYVYSDSESYVFILLGTSTYETLNETPTEDWSTEDKTSDVQKRYKYSLTRTKLSSMPSISVGDKVNQVNGFRGVVNSIDTSSQVVKVTSCYGVDQIDKAKVLTIGSEELATTNVFSYEQYRKVISYGGLNIDFGSEYNSDLASAKIKIETIYTSADFVETGENLTKIQHTGEDTDITRAKTMNSQGRLV